MGTWRGNPYVRAGGYLLGLALLVAAVVMAGREVDLAVLRQASPWALGLMVASVVVNLGLTGGLFYLVTRGFDASPTVGFGRMQALIAGSSLLNFLPLRPGLFGRAVYLKVHHQLPVRQSVLILTVVLAVGAAVTVGAGSIALFLGGPWRWAAAVAAMLAASAATPWLTRRLLGRRLPGAWAYVGLRAVDLLIASGRLMLAFYVLGERLPLDVAVAAAAAGMLLAMAGVTPNGLGMKEWAVAALAATQTAIAGPVGLAAAILDRAAEAMACLLVGGPSVMWLGRGGPIAPEITGRAERDEEQG